MLSTSQLTRSTTCNIIFYFSKCILQDQLTKKKIGQGSLQNNLLYLDWNLDLHFSLSNVISLIYGILALVIHLRLILMLLLVLFQLYIIANKNFICDICPCAKQARPSFSLRTSCSSHCFELIYVDIEVLSLYPRTMNLASF